MYVWTELRRTTTMAASIGDNKLLNLVNLNGVWLLFCVCEYVLQMICKLFKINVINTRISLLLGFIFLSTSSIYLLCICVKLKYKQLRKYVNALQLSAAAIAAAAATTSAAATTTTTATVAGSATVTTKSICQLWLSSNDIVIVVLVVTIIVAVVVALVVVVAVASWRH